MTYSVTFDKQISLTEDESVQPSPVRVSIQITAVTDFTDKGLFAYMLNPVTKVYEYNHVATPNDLQDYNYQQAGGEDFVRQDSIDIVKETAELGEEFVADVEARLQLLCNDMQALQNLGTAVTVTITAA